MYLQKKYHCIIDEDTSHAVRRIRSKDLKDQRGKLEGKKEWRGWQRWIACRVDNPSTTNALINNFLFHGTNLAFVQFLFILMLFVDIPLISSGFRLTRFRPSQTRNELIVLWSLSYRLYHTNIRNFASQ